MKEKNTTEEIKSRIEESAKVGERILKEIEETKSLLNESGQKNNTSIENEDTDLDSAREVYKKRFLDFTKIKSIGKNISEKIGDFTKGMDNMDVFLGKIKNLYDSHRTKKGKEMKEAGASNTEVLEEVVLEEESELSSKRAEALGEKKAKIWQKALEKTMPIAKTTWSGVKKGASVGLDAWKRSGNWGWKIIDRRGEKPENAEDLIEGADNRFKMAEAMRIDAEDETDKTNKKAFIERAKNLEKEAKQMKDEAKGKIIYQYRVGQLARSAILFGLGGGLATGTAMFAARLARGVAIGMAGASGLAYNDTVLKTKLDRYENDSTLTPEEIEKKKRKAKILHNSMKVVLVGLMVGGNVASGNGKILGFDTKLGTDLDSRIADGFGTGDNETPNDTTVPPSENEEVGDVPVEKEVPAEEVIEKINVSPFSIEVSSNGAIATIQELKVKLAELYPDANQAPENIKYILNTNSISLSQEWGMFNPDEAKESAWMLKGSSITVDEKGNVTLHNLGKGDTVLSGQDAKQYTGKMFDSDANKSQEVSGNDENKNIKGEEKSIDDAYTNDEYNPSDDYPSDDELGKRYDKYGNEIEENTNTNTETNTVEKNNYNTSNYDGGSKIEQNNMYDDYVKAREASRASTGQSGSRGAMSTSNYDVNAARGSDTYNRPRGWGNNQEPNNAGRQEDYEIALGQEFHDEVDQIFGKHLFGASVSDGMKTKEWLYLKNATMDLDTNGKVTLHAQDGASITQEDAEGRIYGCIKRLNKFIANQDIKPVKGETIEVYLKKVAERNI